MKFKLVPFFLLIIISTQATALDKVNSVYGGLVQQTDHAIFELVDSESKTDIYIRDPKKKNLANEKLSIAAVAEVHGKKYNLALNFEKDHYNLGSMGAYSKIKNEKNFILTFTINFAGKEEKTSFHIGK